MARIIWNPAVPVIYKSEKKRKLSLSESPGKDTPKHLYQSSLFTLFSVSHSAKNILLFQPVKKKTVQIMSSFFPSSFNETAITWEKGEKKTWASGFCFAARTVVYETSSFRLDIILCLSFALNYTILLINCLSLVRQAQE